MTCGIHIALKQSMKFIVVNLLVFSIQFVTSSTYAANELPREPKDVTMLIYYSGDNRLSDFMHSSYLRVLREGAGKSIHVVVQFDGSKPRDSFRVSIEDSKKDMAYEQTFFQKNIEYNMGNPQTLVDFVKWGKTNFPAKRTILVISSYGYGILNNPFPEDDSKRLKKSISKLASSIDDSSHSFMIEEEVTAKLKKALGNEKLDLLIHNSCLMGSLESLTILSSIAKFAITSEYSIYMNTNDDLIDNEARTILLENIIHLIKDRPSISEQEIGKKVVMDFEQSYKNFKVPTDSQLDLRYPSTMAFYDLSYMHSLAALYSDLAKEFKHKAIDQIQILYRFYDENLRARYVDSFGYLDIRVLYKNMLKAINPEETTARMKSFDALLAEVVPVKVALFTDQPEAIAHLHVFFPSILTQANIKPFQKSYSEIKAVQYYGWADFVDFFWINFEKNRDSYWLSKLKNWNAGQIVIVKPTSTSSENDEDLFLQLDMMVIRLARIPGQEQLQSYSRLLSSLNRRSESLDKQRDYVRGLIK